MGHYAEALGEMLPGVRQLFCSWPGPKEPTAPTPSLYLVAIPHWVLCSHHEMPAASSKAGSHASSSLLTAVCHICCSW